MREGPGLDLRKGIQNIPYYEPGRSIQEIKERYGLLRIIKMASNENPLGPSPRAIEAIRKSLEDVNYYPDSNSTALKLKLAGKLNLEPSWLVVGNGSVEIIQMIAETFLNPGEGGIVGRPSFLKYEKAIHIAQGRVIAVPTEDYGLDLTGMVKRIDPRTKVIFIANPNNPTGTILLEPAVREFLDSVPERVLVVFDEAYYEYIEEKDYPDTIGYVKEGRNIVVLRTFSKIYGLAGLRIGYGIARPEIIRELERVRETFNTSSLAQVAAREALDDFEHVKNSKGMNREGRSYLTDALRKMGFEVVKSYTNFLMVVLPVAAKDAFELLLREGVIVRPLDFYGLKNAIRVTVGTPEENEVFLEALEKINLWERL